MRVLLGQACRALGDDETSALEFSAARAVFEHLGAKPELTRLNAVVDTRPTSSHQHPLTPRELLWTPPGMPPTFIIPPIPDYPSAAAVTSTAAAEVLTAHLGRRVHFEAASIFLPGATRHFRSFRHAAHESGWSRVYGGIHFVRAVEDGFKQGKGIAREVSRMLPRVRR